MPELPILPESPPVNNNEVSSPNENLVPTEAPKPELGSNAAAEAPTEIETPLPPVLQPDAAASFDPSQVSSTAAPINLVQKGARVSSLTTVALRTFANLQRKLAVHYQKLRGKVGAG